jgi:aspartate--ammonia ligase
MKLLIPQGYKPKLGLRDTEVAIKKIKDYFERALAYELYLTRVSAPLFVKPETGLNDDLNGVERPVSFDVLDDGGSKVEIVHSLAKWKRMALARYQFSVNEGLYTDMNAIRRDEELDNIHSIYVDQWDWEKITFITSQELLDMYPDLTSKERENAFCKEKKAIFIMKIGGELSNGEKHDGRAPDYDDWELNGDILFWNPILDSALELSSMGIRVDEETLAKQLKVRNCEERLKMDFHQKVMNKELPYTIGGGIGQSRICMYFLQKAHIGEVHASTWPDEMIAECEKNNIILL